MSGLAAFVQSAGAAMGFARDSFGTGTPAGPDPAPPPAPPAAIPGASGQAADGFTGESDNIGGQVDGLDANDTAAAAQLAAAAQASGAGRGRMEAVIAAAVADVHALGFATNTPAGQAALIAAIKTHLQQTQTNLDAGSADAGTHAAASGATAAAYRGATTPAASGAAMPQMGQLVSGITPLASAAGAPLQALSGLGGSMPQMMAPLASMSSPAAPHYGKAEDAAAMPELAGEPLATGQPTAATEAARRALSQLGKPYGWGSAGPSSYDCSGLCQWSYRGVGVNLPRETYDMVHVGQTVPRDQVRAGDLVFSNFSARGPEHVQMAISPTQVVEAPTPGGHVQVSSIPNSVIVKRVVV